MNKHQHTTRGIKHWGLSCYSSTLPRIKFGVTGQESNPHSPTISYANVGRQFKTATQKQKKLNEKHFRKVDSRETRIH